MLEFKKLDDPSKIKKYLYVSDVRVSDLSVGLLYMWRKDVDVRYAVIDDTLILSEAWFGGDEYFSYPMGANIEGALSALEEYCRIFHKALRFSPLDEKRKEALKKRYPATVCDCVRDWSDYIYNADDMKYFHGKKLSGQRNHVNAFLRLYGNYEYVPIGSADAAEIEDFLKEFGRTRKFTSDIERREYEYCFDLIEHMDELGMVGGCIRLNGKTIAFSIGEIIGDTLIIHVEKADMNYHGAYQVIVSEFARCYATGDVKFINREDDSGDEGLRTSKLQYHPIELRAKNDLLVETLVERLSQYAPVALTGENISIDEISEADANDFFRLSTDDENNRFWGYDYREDLSAQPTPAYFLDFVKEMKKTGEEYSLAVRHEGKFIGEVVLHNCDAFLGAEIGVRLLGEYQGRGYAAEAVRLLGEYALSQLNAQVIRAKCHKQNQRSARALVKGGLIRVGEDDTFIYFAKRADTADNDHTA